MEQRTTANDVIVFNNKLLNPQQCRVRVCRRCRRRDEQQQQNS